MQVLILYYSRTGNTKLLAEEVAKGVREVQGVDCIIKSNTEVTKNDLLAADGIIAGSPNYFGSMASELKEIFDRFVGIRPDMEDKIGAAFTTGGDTSGGRETTLLSILQAMLIYGMIVVGDPLDAAGHYGVACVDAPDSESARNAAKLGRRVATLVRKFHENTTI
jgi:NAD(P)H dehydrogenase (quinone)